MGDSGFEPLTSSASIQCNYTAAVRQCLKTPAKQRVFLLGSPRLFAVVRVGWCTNGVLNAPHKTAELAPADQCASKVRGSPSGCRLASRSARAAAESGSATTASAPPHAGPCISIQSCYMLFAQRGLLERETALNPDPDAYRFAKLYMGFRERPFSAAR